MAKKSKTVPLNEKFRILFRILYDIIERKNILDVTSIEISHTQFLLLKILSATGPYSVHELANILHISDAATSKNIDYLVRKRLISRKVVSSDRRAVNVSILNKGAQIIDEFNLRCEKKINSVLSHFDAKEKKSFNDMLDKYIHYSLDQEENLSLFCLQCGGKYEGDCPCKNVHSHCYFQLKQDAN